MNNKTRRAIAAILATATAIGAAARPSVAQAPLRSVRAAAAMPAAYSGPLCELKGEGADESLIHLREALNADQPDRRAHELDKGRESLVNAIVKDKRDKSSTAWYTVAQIYLYQGDVVGADSALRHVQEISPKCAQPLEALRYMIWAPLINAGADFAKAGANDSALALFQEAAAIYPEKPQAALSAGVILANGGQTDSAIVYFERAAAAAERANLVEERNQATRNLAAMLQRAERHQEAAAALERYLEWQPDDEEVKRGLAFSYRALGRTDEARALEGQLGAAPTATSEDALHAAVNLYQEHKYAEAAEAFERVRAAAPYSREALLGLAASYQELNDGPKLVEAAGKLVEREPLSVDALRLLGVGYQLTKQSDQAVETAKRLVGMVTSVAVQRFTASADSATFTATATGRAAETIAGKPIPPAATALVFEFVDSQGNVVFAEDVQIPPLKPNEAFLLTVQGHGKGIVAWRYRRKMSP
jgi:tetratricopeptide (TPR) repeat protein